MINFLKKFLNLGLVESASAQIDDDDHLYRRLTGNKEDSDLSSVSQERMIKLVRKLWESNMLANRMIELPLSYILGEGLRMTVDDEDNQKIIDSFWTFNDLDLTLIGKIRELLMFGEQCWPVFVNPISGAVRIGYLPPSVIDRVITDPQNVEQPIGIKTKADLEGNFKLYKVIVKFDDALSEDAKSMRENFTAGEAFFYRINGLVSGTRGRSLILAQIDWVDAYENYLYGEMERFSYLSSFIWDVHLKGARDTDVLKRSASMSPPKPGSLNVHNDSEVWSAVTPDIKSVDTSEAARLFRNHALGGGTIPEHWFGGGGDVNRATGESMADPTLKVLASIQKQIKHMLDFVGYYVLEQHHLAAGAGSIPIDDPAFMVNTLFPELGSKDIARYAASLQQVVAAVAFSVQNGLLTMRTAVQLIQSIAGRLGVEFDAEKELIAVMEEVKTQPEEDKDVTATPVEEDG